MASGSRRTCLATALKPASETKPLLDEDEITVRIRFFSSGVSPPPAISVRSSSSSTENVVGEAPGVVLAPRATRPSSGMKRSVTDPVPTVKEIDFPDC